jgi:type I restriction enzyme, R subunit
VVTDRRVLDKQIEDTGKQFVQVSATIGHAERSGDLRRFLREGKKILISRSRRFRSSRSSMQKWMGWTRLKLKS